jgi:uncharacterized RDD family membrane protein YckC
MRFFNRITLRTPESVEIDFELAGIGNRAYALAIDYIILGLIISLCLVIWTIFYFQLVNLAQGIIGLTRDVSLWLIALGILVLFAIYVGYFVFFESLWQGQTPGKRFVKIRVICNDGKPVGLAQSALRALLRPVDEFLWLGMFLIVFGKQEKRLGDWVAGTLVIQEQNISRSSQFPISQEANQLASQLLIEADLSQMLPQDFGVVREYLHRRSGMIPQARRELARKLASQLRNIIKLDKIPEDVTANIFLEAVYLAYQRRE